MSKIFSKEVCMQRLKAEGKINGLNKESIELMDRLDGLEVIRDSLKMFEFGQFWYLVDADELGTIGVNVKDCIDK